MIEGMQIAREGETPKARMVKPGTKLGDFVRGVFYINAKLAAGWEIIPDVQNRLLAEWVRVEGLCEKSLGYEPQPDPPIHRAPAAVTIAPPKKKRGRPEGSKNKRK